MANVYIILGAVLIAIGGYMATYGWNLKSSKEIQVSLEQSRLREIELQREGLIKAVFLEVIVNRFILDSDKFTEKNKEELSKFVIFPRFRTEALTAAMASALFLEKKHRKLYEAISGLLGNFNDTNNRLNRIESTMRRLTIKLKWYS
jgi:L-cystine uptake protein TcyP (sodium:dicarboxylate symporter family)